MRNKLIGRPLFYLALLILIAVLVMSCTVTSPIVGKWRDTRLGQYVEFSRDGRIVFDDGRNIIMGKYELVGENYVKVELEGIAGAFAALFGAETWRFEISGDTMTLYQGGQKATLKRVK